MSNRHIDNLTVVADGISVNWALKLAGLSLTFAACSASNRADVTTVSDSTETSDVASEADALSRVSLGPFDDVPVRHGIFLNVREGSGPQPEIRELVYSAQLSLGHAVTLAAMLPVDGELPERLLLGGQPALHVVDGQLVQSDNSASGAAAVHWERNGQLLSAASGSLQIDWEAHAHVTVRLADLNFVDSARTPVPGLTDMRGTISGSLAIACANLKGASRPAITGPAGQPVLNTPEYTWDAEWSSDFCARKHPELEALFGRY